MAKPKIGDRRNPRRCEGCGDIVYEVFRKESADHSKVRYIWRPESHGDRQCIIALRRRLEEVEQQLNRVTIHITTHLSTP